MTSLVVDVRVEEIWWQKGSVALDGQSPGVGDAGEEGQNGDHKTLFSLFLSGNLTKERKRRGEKEKSGGKESRRARVIL